MKNRIAALSLTLALSVGLCAPAQAADSQTVQATLNAGITVTMDGTPQTFHDAQGAVVLPVTYNGTTYLPVRAVSALVGLGVEWEAETQTVKLTTPEDPKPTTSPADGTGDGLTSQTVPALLNGAITVTLDGVAQTFHDAQGAVVLPLTYNGTTYLPVRAVCGLVGLPVEWVQETSTVKLGSSLSGGSYDQIEKERSLELTREISYDNMEEILARMKSTWDNFEVIENPPTKVPAEAIVITPDMIYDDLGATYEDGAIILYNSGATSGGSRLYFKNPGNSTLHFTLTTGSLQYSQWLYVSCMDSYDGQLIMNTMQGPNTTRTYSVKLTGTNMQIGVFAGALADATITNIYLT